KRRRCGSRHRPRRLHHPLELAVFQTQNFRGVEHSVLPRHFCSRCPQRLWNRQAGAAVCPPPAFKAPVNPPHSVGKISWVGRHRQSSFRPLDERLTLASSPHPSHPGLLKGHDALTCTTVTNRNGVDPRERLWCLACKEVNTSPIVSCTLPSSSLVSAR